MLCPHDYYEFSIPVVLRSKAQRDGNGQALAERWNAAAKHDRDALRVSLSTPTDFVASLANGPVIACEMRLAVNVDKLTETAIVAGIEH